MPINEAWLELLGLSSPKMNAMTIVGYTGSQISALSSTAVDGQIVYCYSTGSNYTRGHWYGWDSELAGGSWVDLTALPSNYDFYSTSGFLHAGMVIDRRHCTEDMWTQSNSGTGTDVGNFVSDNSEQGIQLVTGTDTTGRAAVYAGGIQCDWGQPMVLKVKFKTDPTLTTGQIVKFGVNIDRAGSGPATRRMFGIEWCDGDSSFQVHSADGTSQSNFDTGRTVTANAVWEADMYFDPGNEVKVELDDGSSVTTHTKTTFIPSSGSTTSDGIIKLSASNNNGSTTSNTIKIYAAYFIGSTADAWWS